MNEIPVENARPAPQPEYERRLAERRAAARKLEGRENVAGQARVATFLAIVAVALTLGNEGSLFILALAASIVAFIGAVVWHRRIVRDWQRAKGAANHYAVALARLDDRWPGVGPDGQAHRRADHLYAVDIDLFGRGSMFQLLCAARTRMGQDTLARWLLEAADPATIRARQAAVEELRNELDLRERFATLDAPVAEGLSPDALSHWASAPRMLTDRIRPALAIALAVASTVALAGWFLGAISPLWFLGIAVVQCGLLLTMRRAMREISKHIDTALGNLNLLVETLGIIESRRFSSRLLQEIVERMNGEGRTPSRQIARLARLADYWESVRRNQFVVPFAFLWMLFVHLAYAIERWRRVNGPLVSRWLAAVGEFEALNSLAGHAYEHPAFPFPEIVDGGPLFKAGQLGHPLISARTRVANDICLDAGHPMLLVSGSNMSGKSTLLRTVGLNAAMALAGGPVCAERLEISPLAIASSMRIVDSLQDGVSAFYAEIRRLRAVCDRADLPPKVLFLLDEILHGTNSHDRRIGAEVVIQCLLDKNAIGLVTTHDLALAEIADRANSLARNVHFEDQLIDDRLEFDYHLRPGVVPKGNGLVLMRLLGFEV